MKKIIYNNWITLSVFVAYFIALAVKYYYTFMRPDIIEKRLDRIATESMMNLIG